MWRNAVATAFGLCMSAAGASASASGDPAFRLIPDLPEHSYVGGWEHFVGGGAAGFDCDGDDLPEVYVAGGEAPAQLLRNTTIDPGAPLRFQADTPEELALTRVTGAYPLDFDNDAVLDLIVLRVGQNIALRGLGGCRFEPALPEFSKGDNWSTAFSATWEPGQTRPMMAVGNYVDRENPDGPFEACDVNHLFRPSGAGYGPATALSPGFCALSILFSDWSRKGRADLRMSNDRHYYVRKGHEQLWRLDDIPRLVGSDEGWVAHKLWGMGIASRDITGDGLPEVFLTSMGDQRMQMLQDAVRPTYADAPYDRGTTAQRPYFGDDGRPSTGWHAEFGDVNNDGLDDLFIAKGNVDQMPSNAMADPNNLLIQGGDGRFQEQGLVAGIATTDRSRGAIVADLNLDGLLDLVVVNRRAPLEIYQNATSAAGKSVSVSLAQPGFNRFAIGAWIELRTGEKTQTREVTVGGGHVSGFAGAHHFGLGTADSAKVRVIWPDGTEGSWHAVKPGRYTITPKQISRY